MTTGIFSIRLYKYTHTHARTERKDRRTVLADWVRLTLPASFSGTVLQTLPELVTPLKGHSFISAQLSTDAVGTLRTVWVLIRQVETKERQRMILLK